MNYQLALAYLRDEVSKLPMEEMTLWNEACLDMAALLEKYPGLLDATSAVFTVQLMAKGKK